MSEGISVDYGDSLYTSCPSACCKDMSIFLKPPEAQALRSNGTHLGNSLSSAVLSLVDGSSQDGEWYAMKGSCGNLRTEKNATYCAAYDERPEVCRIFRAGSRECERLRENAARLSLSRTIVPSPEPSTNRQRHRSVD